MKIKGEEMVYCKNCQYWYFNDYFEKKTCHAIGHTRGKKMVYSEAVGEDIETECELFTIPKKELDEALEMFRHTQDYFNKDNNCKYFEAEK